MEREERASRIEGTILNIVYRNAENGYTVMRLRSGDDTLTAVGCVPGAAAGERLTMDGTWTSHPNFGEQFRIESVERRLPDDEKSVFEFLAFGNVKGIGPATAAAIVEKFGRQALEIMEEQPERLAEVKNISLKKAIQIGNEFRKQMGIRYLMSFLAENGIGTGAAAKLYKVYGNEALSAVRGDPYILAEEAFGADFFGADRLALSMGFDSGSGRRVEAAVMFELRYNQGNGHVFLPRDKLAGAAARLVSVEPEAALTAIDELCRRGDIVSETVAKTDACYPEEMYEAERLTAERIGYMAAHPEKLPGNMDRIISSIEGTQGIKYAVLQRKAVETAAREKVMVLTGGPGTGKTTAVCGILALFDKMGFKTALTAPTGRAAKRMAELTGREAATIHRLLGAGYSGDTGEMTFERCGDDMLEADAVILDEASMVDIELMAALLDAMRPSCRLVLVGDADQLGSVGPGNVFSDIIRSGVVETIELTEIFRQARLSHIVRNAHMINRGVVPDLGENRGDFFFMQRVNKEKTADTIVELCVKRLPENMGIPADSIQVLCPSRKGEAGTISLNRRLQEAINPPHPEKSQREQGDFVFREGDRVMQIRNNYDIIWKKSDGSAVGSGIFNGDIGHIIQIDSRGETVTVEFEDRLACYSFEMLGELELAYAMTVHKSQGSEYRAVILSATREAPVLLTRGLLYTAVTRAKELLVIVGDSGVVTAMTENDKRRRRYSGLRARLAGE